MASISLRDIAKRSGADPPLEGFLDVADGEWLRPSTSGESRSLRMIAGPEELDNGDNFVGDREISHLPPRDRHVGWASRPGVEDGTRLVRGTRIMAVAFHESRSFQLLSPEVLEAFTLIITLPILILMIAIRREILATFSTGDVRVG